jgi:hypothetical protein
LPLAFVKALGELQDNVPSFPNEIAFARIEKELGRKINEVYGDKEPSIESYIFDFDGDLYGDVLRVRFLHRIRDERKFSGIEELKNQIEKDTRRALNYFKRLGVTNSLNIV